MLFSLHSYFYIIYDYKKAVPCFFSRYLSTRWIPQRSWNCILYFWIIIPIFLLFHMKCQKRFNERIIFILSGQCPLHERKCRSVLQPNFIARHGKMFFVLRILQEGKEWCQWKIRQWWTRLSGTLWHILKDPCMYAYVSITSLKGKSLRTRTNSGFS